MPPLQGEQQPPPAWTPYMQATEWHGWFRKRILILTMLRSFSANNTSIAQPVAQSSHTSGEGLLKTSDRRRFNLIVNFRHKLRKRELLWKWLL